MKVVLVGIHCIAGPGTEANAEPRSSFRAKVSGASYEFCVEGEVLAQERRVAGGKKSAPRGRIRLGSIQKRPKYLVRALIFRKRQGLAGSIRCGHLLCRA